MKLSVFEADNGKEYILFDDFKEVINIIISKLKNNIEKNNKEVKLIDDLLEMIKSDSQVCDFVNAI